MATYKFVNAEDVSDGSGEYDLSDGTNTFISERTVTGMGMPPINVRSDQRSRRAGVELRSAQLTPRSVGMVVRFVDSTHNNLQDRLRAAIKYMAGSYGREEPRIGQLRVTPAGESERYLRCVCVVAEKSYSNAITDVQAWLPLRFFADHPNWYNPTEQTTTITIGSGAGNAFPLRAPFNFGLDGYSGGGTVTNSGDVETRSLLVSVPGPCTSPGIINDTVGSYVRLTDLTVPDGSTLKIRMGWRPDGIREHKAVLESAQGDETNVLGYLDTNSAFFHLEPGANEISVVQDTPTTGTVYSLGWYHEYLSM